MQTSYPGSLLCGGVALRFVLLALATSLSNESSRADSEMPAGRAARGQIILNGVWQWQEATAAEVSPEEAKWQNTRVPEVSRQYQKNAPEAIWYRLRFTLPDGLSVDTTQYELFFRRVRHYALVKLNGVEVARHASAIAGFSADVTDTLKRGGENELLVFVHNSRDGYERVGKSYKDPETVFPMRNQVWKTLSDAACIEDDVLLDWRPKVHVARRQVITSVRQKKITAKLWIENDGAQAATVDVTAAVKKGGKTVLDVGTTQLTVAPGETKLVELSRPWTNPVLWGSPPHGVPYLYFMDVQLSRGNKPIDCNYTRFGFRETWCEGTKLLLNGKQLRMWGTDALLTYNERQWLVQLFLFARGYLGMNCHDLHTCGMPETYYDVADEMGVYLRTGSACLGGNPGHKLVWGWNDPHWKADAERLWTDYIRTDRNHPAVIMYQTTCPVLSDPTGNLARFIRHEDTTRPLAGRDAYNDICGAMTGVIAREARDGQKRPALNAEANTHNPQVAIEELKTGLCGTFSVHWFANYAGDNERFKAVMMKRQGFTISWPSLSGLNPRASILPDGPVGYRAVNQAKWLYVNWCDASKPAVVPTEAAQTAHELSFPFVCEPLDYTKLERPPELLVTGAEPHSIVFVAPAQGQCMNLVGILADAAGTAWFYLKEPGRYRVVAGDRQTEVAVRCTFYTDKPGYAHVQRVNVPEH